MTDTEGRTVPTITEETISRGKVIATRLTVWLAFGVCLGLLPVIANVIKGAMSKDGLRFGEVLGGGELFIVGGVIAAGAIGELFAGGFNGRSRLGTIIAGFLTSLAFGGNTMAYMEVPTTSHETVMYLSLGFFLFTLPGSALSIGLAAGR